MNEKPTPMTDLATRIADVKKKAEAWRDIRPASPRFWDVWKEYRDIDPNTLLAMAARIEELEKALGPFGACFCKPQTKYLMSHEECDGEPLDRISADGLNFGHLRTAARALKGED